MITGGRSVKIGTRMVMAVLIVASVLLASVLIFSQMSPSGDVPDLYIDGNDELLDTADARDWTGSGTLNDPIIIEGLSLPLIANASCISLRNVTLHVMIRNCSFVPAIDDAGPFTGT